MAETNAQTGKKPGAGLLRRISRREFLKASSYTAAGGVAATVFRDHVDTVWPNSWTVKYPKDIPEDIVSRLGLKNDVEYVAVQVAGKMKRVAHQGVELDPDFDDYVPVQPITKTYVFKRQADGSYTSKDISEGGKQVNNLRATLQPGQPPKPGTADKMTLDGQLDVYLPAPKPKPTK